MTGAAFRGPALLRGIAIPIPGRFPGEIAENAADFHGRRANLSWQTARCCSGQHDLHEAHAVHEEWNSSGRRSTSELYRGEWATDPCSCFGVQEQVRPPTRPRPLWSADAGTVTISFGEAVRRKTSVIMLFVKLPARQTADLTGRPLQQQNERRPTKRKGQSEVEIVSVCRKDAPHAYLANEILVMQWKPAARWACSIPLGVISEPL